MNQKQVHFDQSKTIGSDRHEGVDYRSQKVKAKGHMVVDYWVISGCNPRFRQWSRTKSTTEARARAKPIHSRNESFSPKPK